MAQLLNLFSGDIARTTLGNQRKRHIVTFQALFHRQSQGHKFLVFFAIWCWAEQVAIMVLKDQANLYQRIDVAINMLLQFSWLPFHEQFSFQEWIQGTDDVA